MTPSTCECGAAIVPGDRFCLECGKAHTLSDAAQSPAPSSAPPPVSQDLTAPVGQPAPSSPNVEGQNKRPQTHAVMAPNAGAVLRSAVGALPASVSWAGALLVLQLIGYFLVGLVSAGASLIDDGLAANTLADLFTMPLRMLLAANGALPEVGWWLNGVAQASVAGWVAVTSTPVRRDGSRLDIAMFLGLAGIAYAVLLVVLTYLVEPGPIPVSPLVELPGDLAEIDRASDWTRTGVAFRGLLLAVLVRTALELPTLPLPARVQRTALATTRGLGAMTMVSALVVFVAGAIRFPSQPTPVGWLAQAMNFLATVLLTAVDLGVFHLVRSIDVLLGGQAVEPTGGAWAMLLVPLTVGAGAAAFRTGFGQSSTPVDLVWSLGGGAVVGLAMLLLGPVTGEWPSLPQGAVLTALTMVLIGLALSSWVRTTLLRLGTSAELTVPSSSVGQPVGAPTPAVVASPDIVPTTVSTQPNASTTLAPAPAQTATAPVPGGPQATVEVPTSASSTPASNEVASAYEPSTGSVVFCGGCGEPTDPSHRFCGRCGRPRV